MAGKRSAAYMTAWEKTGGAVFLALYLLVLPTVGGKLVTALGDLAGKPLSATVQAVVYGAVLLALTLAVFHRFLLRTTERLGERAMSSLRFAGTGLVMLYGANELMFRISGVLGWSLSRWNDIPVAALRGFGGGTAAAVVLAVVIPLAEETLLRGLVFGNLRTQSRFLAYTLSVLAAALPLAVQALAGSSGAWTLTELVRCLVPGLVLAWTYERAGTLWAPFAVHALFNALALHAG